MTKTRKETLQLGLAIGQRVPERNVIALRGDLGAGKTTLCKGIGKGLGIEEEITSPTYTIVAEYRGRLTFYHIDAYRLGGFSDFQAIGGLELLGAPNSLCVIEWIERLPEIESECTAFVTIRMLADDSREFWIEGNWLEELL
ncbi:MAG TPA: tRNA (adenosine(37)-N6)-threonylcarbamoyltransferase complex ATPase subunit type 1 TsaE [Spirochaetales bacterium]|nr:tRNA (adenosine(37)-N6)-threonylcarbamoyltransferase complex ATPase subunit type 1 TsaE [Spirochaetales bacterium]